MYRCRAVRCGFIIGTLLCLLCSGMLSAEEPLTLSGWIERALQENPGYQMALKDYQLALEEIGQENRPGFKRIALSMVPLEATQDGVERNYLPGIDYSAQLPYEVILSGRNFLKKDEQDVIQGGGNLKLSLNLADLWNKSEDTLQCLSSLELKESLYSKKVSLIKDVLDKYVEVLINQEKYQLAQKKVKREELLLERAAEEYKAGITSLIEYYQVDDKLAEEVSALEEIAADSAKVKREFVWLYGSLQFEQNVIDRFDINPESLVLETKNIDGFLKSWDSKEVETYISGNYFYQKNILILEHNKELAKEKQREDWQIKMELAEFTYDTNGEKAYTASLSLAKDLYNPALALDINKADVQLKQQNIFLDDLKNQLIFKLVGQVRNIEVLTKRLAKAEQRLAECKKRSEIILTRYQKGYLTETDLLSGQVQIQEQVVTVLELRKDLLLSKLALGEILGLDELYK